VSGIAFKKTAMSLARRNKRRENQFEKEKEVLDLFFKKLVGEFLTTLPMDENERLKKFDIFEKKWKDAVWSMKYVKPMERTLRKFNDVIYDSLSETITEPKNESIQQ
jgi:hypothetical protein